MGAGWKGVPDIFLPSLDFWEKELKPEKNINTRNKSH
jgi:hypothetical protein